MRFVTSKREDWPELYTEKCSKKKKKAKDYFFTSGEIVATGFPHSFSWSFFLFNKRRYFICLIVFFVKCFMYSELALPLVFLHQGQTIFVRLKRGLHQKSIFFPVANLIWRTCLRNNKCLRQGSRPSITKRYWHISLKSPTCKSTKVLRFRPTGTMNVGAQFHRRTSDGCGYSSVLMDKLTYRKLSTSRCVNLMNLSLFKR